jgi:hypothetical protein
MLAQPGQYYPDYPALSCLGPKLGPRTARMLCPPNVPLKTRNHHNRPLTVVRKRPDTLPGTAKKAFLLRGAS